MDDNAILYEKMKVINHNLDDLIKDIDNFKDALVNNFCVDDSIVHSNEIEEILTNIRDIKISSKYDIIDNLKSDL